MVCELYLNKAVFKTSFYLFVRHIFKINPTRKELVGGGVGFLKPVNISRIVFVFSSFESWL